jgi:Cu-Zn family superoxide dismutase
MFLRTALALALLASAAAAPSVAQPAPAAAPATAPAGTEVHIARPSTLAATAGAEIKDATGKTIGRAFFHDGPRGMLMRIEAGNLSPGWHGVHLHEKGVCTAPDFASAGGHINPGHKTHGLLNAGGAEAGDLPSLFVNEAGITRTSLFTDLVSGKGEGGRTPLLDADGSAIVIHAAADDQSSQPIGGSGARVACGVIIPPPPPPGH